MYATETLVCHLIGKLPALFEVAPLARVSMAISNQTYTKTGDEDRMLSYAHIHKQLRPNYTPGPVSPISRNAYFLSRRITVSHLTLALGEIRNNLLLQKQ